ncbi:MAG: hypothetical protein CME62_14200 [Halobacteriovoraceae bacterium]|nr:hypothetical protein [Halobacteriovoraceae bacterium]|tara:strand:- start:13724 stop:14563 length:840 start_codon:yes stop_codon:yes gene_type:complete
MKKVFLATVLSLTLVACNGGNGSGSTVTNPNGTTVEYSHNELAELFVNNLNLSAEFEVSLVKSSTLQYDFIVIYDATYGTYDAVNISSFTPGVDSAEEYYNNNSARFYYDLIKKPGHYEYYDEWVPETYDSFCDCYEGGYYEEKSRWIPTRYLDPYTNLLFEKTAASSKDLAKIAALKEVAQVEKSAKFLSSEFGLSLDRSKQLARLTAHWKKASKKGMTASEQDAFATEALGFSITQGIQAVQSADATSLNDLVEQAADTNGITPEHAGALMTKLFGM